MLDLGSTWVGILLAVFAVALLGAGMWRYVSPARTGQWMLFVGFCFVSPLAVLTLQGSAMQRARSAEFCGSCHQMGAYTAGLDHPDAEGEQILSAMHVQRGWVQRKEACYTCHSDYEIFGGVKDKLRGLRHLYAAKFYPEDKPIRLYKPYPSTNCLRCHEHLKRYQEASTHADILGQLRDGKISCLFCHEVAHPKP